MTSRDELLEKYQDALDCADSWLERNMYAEIIEDLEHLNG